MKSLKQYWNETYKSPNLKITYDNWLNKYDEYLTNEGDLIIDLGCGIGNNSLYLFEKGILPVACDISEEALHTLRERLPSLPTLCLDMTQGLPFENKSAHVLIADLCLHYFDEETTLNVIKDIHRVMKPDGIVLCRLNSINEVNNLGPVKQSDDRYLFENEGIYRRLFDRAEIDRFFDKTMWELVHAEEYEMDRYTRKKMLWEIAIKPRQHDQASIL
ncbi:class I SAM-dependent methyltransferase [Paenibacillus roseipurpureus]|uniref:Class I SAM-dependent methyltransferase n=1 Tax=Paenibacillus roseopurpureus TaxID=2918901 RepID=A0AA96LHU3_9BACL|nr:class I SAM-dependent methyltransferase [Paenibacillus sp. MBLB1832]WNR42062.1 class I SAM-dependent methyltransferase [Paenibacillus sp. MBLB1832]